jgi:hypothetical protein
MSSTQTELVIQISTSGPASDLPGGEKAGEGRLLTELRRCLQPGAEIVLVFRGYTAITSILWLSEPLTEHGLRAGVRLLGVSALPAGKHPESAVPGTATANDNSGALEPGYPRSL